METENPPFFGSGPNRCEQRTAVFVIRAYCNSIAAATFFSASYRPHFMRPTQCAGMAHTQKSASTEWFPLVCTVMTLFA